MIINVTSKHIEEGKRMDCRACPVALAVGEKMGQRCYAGYNEIIIGPSREQSIHYETPYEVANFINDFDLGGKVAPFSFELKI